jgi:predicted PurR-regulated permease PerM
MSEPAASAEPAQPPTVEAVPIRGLTTTVVFGSAALYVIHEGAAFFAPIFVSVLLTYVLEPVVGAIMRCRLPRSIAIVVTYFAVALALVACAQTLKRQTTAFLDQLPAATAAIRRSVLDGSHTSSGPVNQLQDAANELQATLGGNTPPPAAGVARVSVVEHAFDVRDYIASAWSTVLEAGAQLLVIAVLTFVLLLGGDQVRRKLVDVAGPQFERRILTIDVIRTIDRQIQRYLVARVMISAMVAAATAAGMWWLGVRQPLVLGLIAGVLNVMPFVGPAIGVAICAGTAFLQSHAMEPAFAAAAVATVVAALEGNLVTPWLTSRAGELNTVAVFVSVLVWGWMWGVWGLLLAVPIMVSLKAAADQIEPLQPLGELLGR